MLYRKEGRAVMVKMSARSVYKHVSVIIRLQIKASKVGDTAGVEMYAGWLCMWSKAYPNIVEAAFKSTEMKLGV